MAEACVASEHVVRRPQSFLVRNRMRALLGVGVLLLIHANVAAQVNRLQANPSWLSESKNATVAVAWGDANGDGNLDLDPVNVSVIMRDSVEADSVVVMHRTGGDSQFSATRLTKTDDPVNDQYGGFIPGEAVSTLQPFEGYWIKNIASPERTVDLSIPPESQPASAVKVVTRGSEKDDDWTISIRASSQGVRDGSNVMGVRSGARSAHDRYDRAEPPMSPGRAVSLYFPHSDWEEHPDRYATDMRGMKDESVTNETGHASGQRWRFDVAKNFSLEAGGDLVELSFLGTERIPDEAEAYFVDRRLGRTIDLRNENTYSFYAGERLPIDDDHEARFVIVVGSQGAVEDELPDLPAKTVLRQNVPNPFNPSTIIRYEIAEAGEITLAVFDITGALIGVVEHRFRGPGRYETRWNGENQRGERVASGVYFYRLTAPGFTQTRKMLLLK